MNQTVDEFLDKTDRWREELRALRRIALACGLVEEVKWGHPCYTLDGGNVLLIGRFKDYCSLTFFKGTLLKDAAGILEMSGENTRVARLVRFTSVQEIVGLEPVLKAYIHEAIEVEKAGLKAESAKDEDLVLVEEIQNKLGEDPALKTAFEALTPGRQRAYNLHVSAAKQSKTRTSRMENCVGRILDGKGLNDCTCGLSKKLPACDGSHKQLR